MTPAGDAADLAAVLERIEQRLTVLEAAVGREDATLAELAKVEWAVKHGRKRPW